MNNATLFTSSKHSAMNKTVSKLALGSANFGLNYGLANHVGKISKIELAKILSFSEEADIDVIDTAQAYGDSETQIGALCNDGRFKMVTKIGIDLENDYVKNSLSGIVEQSCKRLNQSRLYAVMLHRPEVLLGDQSSLIIKDLLKLKEQNIISKIGISVYSPEIFVTISKLFPLDIVQAPFNIFDQQILSSGWSDRLKASDVEIHTRSVFLQGLLLMQQSGLHRYFISNWPDRFNSWYKFLKDNNANALDVALNFALKQDWIDKVVVGVDNVSQLRSLVKIEKSSVSSDFPQLGCDDTNLVNPSKWDLT